MAADMIHFPGATVANEGRQVVSKAGHTYTLVNALHPDYGFRGQWERSVGAQTYRVLEHSSGWSIHVRVHMGFAPVLGTGTYRTLEAAVASLDKRVGGAL